MDHRIFFPGRDFFARFRFVFLYPVGDLDAARRGKQTFEQITLSAEQEDAWKILSERRTGEPLNAEQSLTARNLWASSGQKLSELAEFATQTPTEENLFAFRKMLEVHRAIQNEVVAARTETVLSIRGGEAAPSLKNSPYAVIACS